MLTMIEQVSHQKLETKTKWECCAESCARDTSKTYARGQRSHFCAPIFRFFQGKDLGFIDLKSQ